MSRESYAPPNASEWLVRGLKLVVFPIKPQLSEQQNWWEQLVGEMPEESTRRKTVVEQAGPWGEKRRLSLGIDPFRMQWSLEPHLESVEEATSFPNLGNMAQETERFVGLMSKWLKHAPEINRIGFVFSPMYPVPTHRDGYILLDKLLKTVDVDPDTTDFNYRVNRKAKSAIDGGVINQLATWSALKVSIQLSAPSLEEKAKQHVVSANCFVSLELDANTRQDRTEALASESLEATLRELVALAVERPTKGDIKE